MRNTDFTSIHLLDICNPWFSAHRSESIFLFLGKMREGRGAASFDQMKYIDILVLAITKWNKNRISFLFTKRKKKNQERAATPSYDSFTVFVRLTNLFCQQMSTKTKQGRYGYLWSAAIIHLSGASTESPWCLTKHFEMAKEAMKRRNIKCCRENT